MRLGSPTARRVERYCVQSKSVELTVSPCRNDAMPPLKLDRYPCHMGDLPAVSQSVAALVGERTVIGGKRAPISRSKRTRIDPGS